MAIAAIIPARKGSKGLPGKNKEMVCGRPLVEWSIKQAQASLLVDWTIVSTDDEDISEIAVRNNCWSINRPPALASDTATTESVILDVLDKLTDYRFNTVVLLQPTSPIRLDGEIDNAIRLHWASWHSVASVTEVHAPIWKNSKPMEPRTRRQDAKNRYYIENGSIYVFDVAKFLITKDRFDGEPIPYFMHPLDSFQIDTWEDLEIVRELLPLRLGL